MTAVLLNRQRHLIDVNLLDHTGLAPGRGFQPMAALGTKIDTMIERPGVDGLGRERIPFVFRVSGLATDLALSLAIGGRRLGRLDDIGRRRLGRCRGILPRRRELLLEPCDSGLECSEFRAPPIADRFGQDFRALVFMDRYAKSLAANSP